MNCGISIFSRTLDLLDHAAHLAPEVPTHAGQEEPLQAASTANKASAANCHSGKVMDWFTTVLPGAALVAPDARSIRRVGSATASGQTSEACGQPRLEQMLSTCAVCGNMFTAPAAMQR